MHQIVCRLGLYPKPNWRSLQRSPDPLAVTSGPTSKGGAERGTEGAKGERRGGRGDEGKRRGGERRRKEGVRPLP